MDYRALVGIIEGDRYQRTLARSIVDSIERHHFGTLSQHIELLAEIFLADEQSALASTRLAGGDDAVVREYQSLSENPMTNNSPERRRRKRTLDTLFKHAVHPYYPEVRTEQAFPGWLRCELPATQACLGQRRLWATGRRMGSQISPGRNALPTRTSRW